MKDRQLLNQKHLDDPRVGDYWQEMCSPVCVVVARFKNIVVICRTTKSVYFSRWTWNLDEVEAMSLAKFREWLSYKSESMKDKTWCSVEPEHHKRVAECDEFEFDPCLMGM